MRLSPENGEGVERGMVAARGGPSNMPMEKRIRPRRLPGRQHQPPRRGDIVFRKRPFLQKLNK